ncbi:uncharacterized protein FIBRA_04871 [Fibroporia radiculosa]|uniref:alpha-1,2-Mannosidase n=1 Tax=Fibroporia radiculosa TaxID=599839 RepID=J4G834_9APHY|nr:uncharacterized protein FIBRA_04871 [Fibroporia radiculosa]CCM02763.1 predicted protein [Fibroporia radiculosa]
MADPAIRKRKTGKSSPSQKNEHLFTDSKRGKDGTTIKTVLAAVLVSAGVLLYMNYDTARSFVRTRLGKQSPGWDFEATRGGAVDFSADLPKRDAVVAAFKHAWLAYERDAMGDDEYHPIRKAGSNLTQAGGIGYTVVDSIDSMLLMGLEEEHARARKWVAEKMTFERDGNFNTFEVLLFTTIRVLGGLLSAYHLSGDHMYAERAQDLADRILPVFNTPTGLPLSMVNLKKREGIPDKDNHGLVSTAEVSTLQLEFKYLAMLADDDEYWRKAEKVMQVIKDARIATGLASIFLNPDDGKFAISPIRLGSRGDSYYEYLLKQYLQTNLTEPVYRDMYDDAMDAIHTHLMKTSEAEGLTYTAEILPERDQQGKIIWRVIPKQDHLVCFFGGSLMLGAVSTGTVGGTVSVPPRAEELTAQGKRDWLSGTELVRTCMATHNTATGLSPEIVHFRMAGDGIESKHDWYIKGARPGYAPYDARYILRPETVESLFIAFRLTGDPQYRAWGWDIFQAIEKHCRVESGGYASVLNVDELPVKYEDKMETFLMSETLKYLYLLFSDESVLPLNKYVFNTEAHPFPVFYPSLRTGFS